MLYSVDLGLRNSLIVSYSKGCLNGSIGKKLASVPNLQLVEQEATVVPLLLHGLQLLAIERYVFWQLLTVHHAIESEFANSCSTLI